MLHPGDRLGSFIIEEPLGQGGMGMVYAAVDERLGRRVAIKVVAASLAGPDGRKRLIREARLMAALEHPGIVPIYELGEHGEDVYIVMELVRGRSLSGLLAELGPAPGGAVASMGAGIAAAASAAHEAGILHRDIKPMNVMLRRDGVVKVLDFGIAKPAEAEQLTALTRPGSVAGTPTYLAPELLHGAAASVLSDIWSLGVTLAEMAAGALPFKAGSLVELVISVTSLPPDMQGISSEPLRQIIEKTLQKRPEERPQSMNELMLLLEPLADTALLRQWAEPGLPFDRPVGSKKTLTADLPKPPSASAQSFQVTPHRVSLQIDKNIHSAHPSTSESDIFGRTMASEPPPPPPSDSNTSNTLDQRLGSSPYGALADEIAQRLSNVLRGEALPKTDSPPSETGPRGADTPAERTDKTGLARVTTTTRASSRQLNEDVLDDLANRLTTLPEPIALLLTNIEVARADGDATGIRKRLFELGVGVVRYAVSAGLAVLFKRLRTKNMRSPAGLGGSLRKAFRLSDGQWAELGRSVASELRSAEPSMQRALRFLSEKALADLINSRNLFIHGGAQGDDAPERTAAVLDSAEELLRFELRFITSLDPGGYELRRGTPIRAGVWRKTRGALPDGAQVSEAYLMLKDEGIQVTPWLPYVDGRLLLVDSPHAAGKPWRSMDPESGEHREYQALDRMLKDFLEPDASAPVPLSDRPPLVGRNPVINTLKRACEDASRGSMRVVVLTGPFGIGRSYMAQTVAASAAGLGFSNVLSATCSPERRSMLRPFLRALEAVQDASAKPSTVRSTQIRDNALLGAASPKTIAQDASTTELKPFERLFEAVTRAINGDVLARREGIERALEGIEETLIDTSMEAPILLVVDDAQWADDQTLSLLRLLTERAARGGRGNLLLLITVRDEPSQRPALRKLLGQIAREAGHSIIRAALPPLESQDAAKVVRGVGPIEPDVERVLVEGAAGVPFFLVQPLLVWSESGLLTWKEKVWTASNKELLRTAVPGVGDLIKARLDSFFDPGSDAERAAQQALACVALYGGGLPLAIAISAMNAVGTAETASEHALEALVEASILRTCGERQELRFGQAIVQQALLGELRAKPWFRRVQRALLDTLANAPDAENDALFLASGFESLGAFSEGAHWLRKAASHGFRTGAFDDALECSERLLKIAKTPFDRQRAELSLAEALFRLGRAPEAKTRIDSLLLSINRSSEAGIEARILSLLIAHSMGDMPQETKSGWLAEADSCGNPKLSIEARLALATCLRGNQAIELIDDGIGYLEQLDENDVGDLRYRALALRFEILWESKSSTPECQKAARLAADAARSLGSEWAELDMNLNFAALESDSGNAENAISLLECVAQKAQERHFGSLARLALSNLAAIKLRAGRFAEAALAAQSAAHAARQAGSTGMLGVAQSVRAGALFQLSDFEEAFSSIEEAIKIKLSAGDANVSIALLRRAEIHAALGRIQEAVADAEESEKTALAAGNIEQAQRARLWHSVFAAKHNAPNALERLKAVLQNYDQKVSQTVWINNLLAEGRALLARETNTP